MTALMTCDEDVLDRDDLTTLLDLSCRIVRGAPDRWRTLAVAFRRGASVDQRVDALLLLAGPLTDVVDPADEEVLLRAFLPRLPVAERCIVLRSVRDALDQADRFAACSDKGDVMELVDDGVGHDWQSVAQRGEEQARDDARYTAERACLA